MGSNRAAMDRLESLLHAQGRAILFHGERSAAEECALAFARKRVGGEGVDLWSVRPEERFHSLESIQGLCREMGRLPTQGTCRCFVLYEAEGLLPPAAHALLKTLEELPSWSVVLLVASDPALLPPTLLSRCLQVGVPAAVHPSRSQAAQDLLSLLLHSLQEDYQTLSLKIEKIAKLFEKEGGGVGELFEVVALWQRDLHALGCGLPEEKLFYGEHRAVLIQQQEWLRPLDRVLEWMQVACVSFERGMKVAPCLEGLLLRL